MYGQLVAAAEERELAPWQNLKVKVATASSLSKDITNTQWALSWEMAEAKKDAMPKGVRGRERSMVW